MPALPIGSAMPDFTLDEPLTGHQVTSADLRVGAPAVVVFTSRDCPHALAWEDRLLRIGRDYEDRVSMVMVSSNNPDMVPACRPEALARHARERGFPIPYLYDADQNTAFAYGAERTPDVYVFDHDHRLAYHGTVDDNEEEPDQVKTPYLRDALEAVLTGAPVPDAETELHGCGIKWKPGHPGSIDYACKLMARRSWSTKDIASMLGYPDEFQFSQRFHELTGQSPDQFLQTLPG
jgi:peroxiredoxin